MARLAFTLTFLFFLFAGTYARTPFEQPENDVADRDHFNSVPESDAKSTLLLPSEKTESQLLTIEWEPVTAETKPIDVDADAVGTTIAEELPESGRPSTIVRFRPINRHFPPRRPHGHGCRHHGMKRPTVSFGDDMILAGGERKEFDPEMWHGDRDGEVRQIPPRWVRFNHHRYHHEGMPKFPHHDRFAKERFRRPSHHEEEEEREEDEGPEEREEGGLLNRFRQYFNHF